MEFNRSKKQNPIVFASDFDGTIYFGNIEDPFKQSDLSAITQFQKAGNLFGVCTEGR